MLRLGIHSYKSNLSDDVVALKDRRVPLVKAVRKDRNSPYHHFLTRKGATHLVDYHDYNIDSIKYPKGHMVKDTQDSKHRSYAIDFEIELNKNCTSNHIDILLCDRYFDVVGNNRISKNLKSKTAFLYNSKRSVKADIIFKIVIDKQEELYVVEFENGKDTKKAVEKCINHGKAILKGSLNDKMSFRKGYRTLWVFESESIMLHTIGRLQTLPFFDSMTEFFLFKSYSAIALDFWSEWFNIDGQHRNLYYK